MDKLLVGNTAGEYLIGTQTAVSLSLLTKFSSCNPLLFFVQAAAQHQIFSVVPPVYEPSSCDWVLVLAWLVFSAALLFVGSFIFERRRGEQAGIAGLCTPLTVILCLVCGFLIFALVFKLLVSASVLLAVLAGIAALILLDLLLLHGPLKGAARLCTSAVLVWAEALIVIAGVALTASGAFGWSNFVPIAEDIASVEVSYTGSSSLFAADLQSASSSMASVYISGVYDYDEESAIELVVEVHDKLISSAKSKLASNADEFGLTVVPYDIQISYTLKNGERLSRYYDRASIEALFELASLDDSEYAAQVRAALLRAGIEAADEEAEEALPDVLSSAAGQAFAYGALYLSDAYLAHPVALDCTDKARKELMEALALDVSAQTSEDRYHRDSAPIAVLLFSLEGQSDAETFASQVGNALIYVSEGFTNTIAWLEDKGLLEGAMADVADISEIVVLEYDPYASGDSISPQSEFFTAYRSADGDDFIVSSDYGSRLSIDDEEQIKELASLLRSDYYLDGEGYLVSVELEDQSYYSYLFLPKADAPDWLRRQVG